MAKNYEQIRDRRNLSAEMQQAAFAEALSKLPLAAIRAAADLTQAGMAERLQVTQAAVSQLEGRGDFLLSTLQRYSDAVDGVLEIVLKVRSKCFRLQHEIGDDASFFALESCSDALGLGAWGAVVGRGQGLVSPKPNDMWTHRLNSVEDVDVTRAFFASANQDQFAQVA